MHGPTVWTQAVVQFALRAEQAGIARAPLLGHAGLTEADLEDPDSRLALESLYAILEGMVQLSGDPYVHMRVTRSMDLASLDALAFVVMTSRTYGAGIRAMLRYQRLWNDGERYDLEPAGAWVRLLYHPWGRPRPAHGLMAEMFAVDVVVNAGAMTGGPFDLPRVLLQHPAPRDRAQHRELLGGIVAEFDQPQNEVWFRAADLERPMAPAGQEAVCAFFERHLEERVRALPETSVAGRTRDVLVRGALREPTVASVARRFHMSPRTLQRRLGDEGTSLRALLDDARRARAIPLLGSGHSIAEVAYLLGFAETSAFHRAFRRWTGRTPETFRRSPVVNDGDRVLRQASPSESDALEVRRVGRGHST